MSIESDDYVEVCKISELKEGQGKRFIVNEVDIAVFKVDGNIYAVSNICPHQHTALIYDGIIEKDCVSCPVHGWTFNLQTGKKTSGSSGLEVYSSKIIGEKLFIKASAKKMNW